MIDSLLLIVTYQYILTYYISEYIDCYSLALIHYNI
jgi:hypothetical protein